MTSCTSSNCTGGYTTFCLVYAENPHHAIQLAFPETYERRTQDFDGQPLKIPCDKTSYSSVISIVLRCKPINIPEHPQFEVYWTGS